MAANDAVSMNVAENRQNVPMAIQENRAAVPMTVAEGGGTPGGLNRKADKVTGAVAGNLAGLDSTGNLTDSGKAPGDFLEAPATAGSEGQVLTADGEGGASWQDPTGGDPTEIIDDNAGSGDTDKVWSADKSHSLLTEINSTGLEIKQIEKLDFDLLKGTTWEMGSFNPSNPDVASNNKIRTGYISVDGMNRIILGCDDDYKFYGLMYDSNKTVISGSEFGWTTTSKLEKDLASNFPTAKYIRLCFQKTDSTADVTIASHMRGIYYNEFVDYIYRSYLLSDAIYGTTQAVTKDSSGRITQITHSSGGSVIRTDTITYGNGTITETRTGFNLTVTITTNLTTLAVEVA